MKSSYIFIYIYISDEKCCDQIKVESEAAAKEHHFWTLGTFVRTTKFPLPGIVYKQVKPNYNFDQYYLIGSKNLGWKVNLELSTVI